MDEIKGLVIDPYCGSGTTLVAAKLLGHAYLGIEISKEYAELSETRLMNYENERSSVLLETGKHTVSQTFADRKANGAWGGKFRPDYDANKQQMPLKLLEPKTQYTKKSVNKARILILRAPGTNRDIETKFAFEQAGATVLIAHINQLFRKEVRLSDYQVLVIPGGFSYGDDIAAGRVLANELRLNLGGDIVRFIEEGKLIIGICNGFQALVKAGFLPEISEDASPRLTLSNNDSGKFECRWVHLGVNKKSPCIFTKGMDSLYVPIAHGEGKIATIGDDISEANIALYYTDERGDITAGYPHNPNGSERNIAGICDATGRIFGLMPHPEDHIRNIQHPQWTRLGSKAGGSGFKIFQNAVDWVQKL